MRGLLGSLRGDPVSEVAGRQVTTTDVLKRWVQGLADLRVAELFAQPATGPETTA